MSSSRNWGQSEVPTQAGQDCSSTRELLGWRLSCHKFGKMVEMMRAKVEEVRRGMIPLVNIVKWHLL